MKVELTAAELAHLASLTRMEGRKKRRQLAKFKAKPGQPEEQAQAIFAAWTANAEQTEAFSRRLIGAARIARRLEEQARDTVVA